MLEFLPKIVKDFSPKPAAYERTDAKRKEGETHIGALLPGRSEARDIFVVARLVDDFTEG